MSDEDNDNYSVDNTEEDGPTEDEAHEEDAEPVKLGRGPLSNEMKAQIRQWAAQDYTVQEIAKHIARGADTVRQVLESAEPEKKPRRTRGTKRAAAVKTGPGKSTKKTAKKIRNAAVPEAAATPARTARRQRVTTAVELLHHQFWVRPDIAVTFTLPADFRTDEAQRLAGMVASLPF